jgi:YVTN family beta-propeller protein
MKRNISFAATIVLLGVSFIMQAQSASSYKIANKIKVEGEGGWDYISCDEEAGRLYISHATVVQVVDEKTGKLAGTIPDTKGVHGIAVAADLNKGFISNGKDSSVTVFDLKTLATIVKVPVTGRNPDAILYDPYSHKVFVFNGRTSNVTVIDANLNAVVATIKLEGKPEFSATDGKGKIFVNIEDKNSVCVINSRTLAVEQYWPVAPGEEPSGLAIDTKNHRLFVVCGNKLMIIVDAQSGKIITSLPIGDRVDGVAFDPGKERAYSSNGVGTVTVVQGLNGDKYTVLETIATQKGARTITVDSKTHHLYLPAAEFEATPAVTAENPRPRPAVKKDSFFILDIETLK